MVRGRDAGASINTPNIGNSALIIEELDWGGQDALNTCENSFFGPHLGLGRQKNVIRLGQTPESESWVSVSGFRSKPNPTPMKGSLGMISCSDPGEGVLTDFDFHKSWVPDLVLHSVQTPSPTTRTGVWMLLILNIEVPAQSSGVAITTSANLHGFVQPSEVPFRSDNGVHPISTDLLFSGDKPLCAGDGDAWGWSMAGSWADMFNPIQHCEQLSVTVRQRWLTGKIRSVEICCRLHWTAVCRA